MTLQLFRDEDGCPRAWGDGPGDLLAGWLESDVQGSPEVARELLDLVDRIASGEMDRWEATGNAYTLTLAPDGATIEAEWEEDVPSRHASLSEVREALAGWLDLIQSNS